MPFQPRSRDGTHGRCTARPVTALPLTITTVPAERSMERFRRVTLPKLTTEDGIMRMAVKRHGEYKDFAIVSYRGE